MSDSEFDQARRFLNDVSAEPNLLAKFVDHRPVIDVLAARRVLVTGMGSSRFAALAAVARWRRLGIDAHVERASVVADLPPSRDLTVIGISASGRTTETLEVLERHRGISRTTLLTNNPTSDAPADQVIALDAGTETGGVACLTYMATLVALLGPSKQELEHAAEASTAIMSGDWVPEVMNLVRPTGLLYMIAPVERMSSAEQAALMVREGPRRMAAACETGDWLHVDVYLSRPGRYRAVLLGGSRFDGAVMRWIGERRGVVVSVGRAVKGASINVPYPHCTDDMVATLVETSVVERLAASWWIEEQTPDR